MNKGHNLGLFQWVFAALLPVSAFAEEAAAAATSSAGLGWGALSVGIGIGLAVLGAGLGQGKIASAFMEGVSRNPGAVDVMKTPLILSLVFVETLVLFTVLIAFMLLGKM